ncbi:hypothetical protein PGT21_014605 [Puccinia graminis f. sp. tritici]|uniref:Uncharacterized protein n=1 Tax=Puccinia graminis f. sp. tritici TaxID=56615 RepID=A0A5B0PNC6_PUCGR|nr:hypothetical protein PGTUg99_034861 [Puccinia graminis f. sp. tritici]KAA1114592.1 hypothetical protein PGT21_014605 [Puccinia graminis f. sp. tritici]
MLRDQALEELKKANAEATVPQDWPSFKAWITKENSLAISKQSVFRSWDQPRQAPNESLENFMIHFLAWQVMAKNYDAFFVFGYFFYISFFLEILFQQGTLI